METFAWILRARLARSLPAIATIVLATTAEARNYLFQNITDLPGSPGNGKLAEVNDSGDIAFISDDDVWLYDRSENSFLNVSALPGAPANPFFVKINNNGDIAIIETPTSTQDLWLFRRDLQAFTNISSLPGYPGDSQSHPSDDVFDINDSRQISFHSGDNNLGSVYVYDHATGSFDWINGKPGATFRARENEINNAGQVLYMGFPMTYLYDPTTNTTTNINMLPGGPGEVLTNLDLNDLGDVALVSTNVAQLYDASSGTFLDIVALPGFPEATASSDSDLGNDDDLTFWLDELYAFDSSALRFSQLTDFAGGLQGGQLENDVNNLGQVVITASTDIYLGTPRPYGDYDNDGDVDGNDLATWEGTYGNTAAIGTAADGNSDREISGLDFLVWQQNYGSGTLVSEASPVPEPASALPAIAMMIGTSVSRFRLRQAASAPRDQPSPSR